MSIGKPEAERFCWAAESILGRSVLSMPRRAWHALIREDGSPTLLNVAPAPCKGVMDRAFVVAVAASGNMNPDPGFDIVRYDPNDAPCIYNVDHYRVVERLAEHPDFSKVCERAGIDRSEELAAALTENVFIVKQTAKETTDHWSTELPNRIQIARHKDQVQE